MTFTREVANYFFIKGPAIGEGATIENNYVCQREALTGQKCCSMKNSFSIISAAGFHNLKGHLLDCVPNYQTIYDNKDKPGAADIRYFISVDNKSHNRR